MKMRAYVAREANKYAMENVELAEPKFGELRVKLVASGVCHTDAAALAQFIPLTLPAVLGHEGVGVVEAVGPGMSDFEVGDHVIMSYPSCGCCVPCQQGKPYACRKGHHMMFDGSYSDGGRRITGENGEKISSLFGQASFAEYSIIEARNAVKVDKSVDLKPLVSLGCGVQTGAGAVLKRLNPKPGSSLVVFGVGAVGIAAIMAAKIAGCSKIIGVDVVPSRLQLALECGATDVINGKEVDAVAKIKELTGGNGANYSVECSGVPALCVQALDCLDQEGTECIVSVTGDRDMVFKPEMQLMTPCRTITGVVEGGSNPKVFIPELVKFYQEGRLPVDKLCKYYKFEELDAAMEDSHSGAVIKPVLVME